MFNRTTKPFLFVFPLITALLAIAILHEIEIVLVLTAIATILTSLLVLQAKRNQQGYSPEFADNIRQARKQFQQSQPRNLWGKKPFTLVVGPQGAGKSALIKAHGATSLTAEKEHDGVIGSWWHHPQQGLTLEIDTADYCAPPVKFDKFWEQYITSAESTQLIGSPMKQILFALPITLLHTSNQAALTRCLDNLQQTCQIIHHMLPQCKMNIAFTHCDKILGFQSFFYDLGTDERAQLLAIFKNHTNYQSPLQQLVGQGLPDMIRSIQQHVLRRLRQEHDPIKKCEIKDFPFQLEQVVEPINHIVKQLERIAPDQFCGIYFCSNSLSDTVFDYIQDTSPTKVTNSHVAILGTLDHASGYFNNHILHQAQCIKAKVQYSRKDMVLIAGMTTFCMISLYICHNIYQRYQTTGTMTQQVQALILSNNTENTSSELDKLLMAWEYVQKTGATTEQNQATDELKSHLSTHYQSTVKQEIQRHINTAINTQLAENLAHNKPFLASYIHYARLHEQPIGKAEQDEIHTLLADVHNHRYLSKHIQQFSKNQNLAIQIEPTITSILRQKLRYLTTAEIAMLLVPQPATASFHLGYPYEALLSPEHLHHTMQIAIPEACKTLQGTNFISHDARENCVALTKTYYKAQYQQYWRNQINLPMLSSHPSLPELTQYLQQLQQNAPQLVQQLQANNQALTAIQDEEQISQNTQWIQLLQDPKFIEIIQGTGDFIDNLNRQPLAAYEEISQQETAPIDSTILALSTLQKRLPVAQQRWIQTITDTLQQACEERAYQYLDEIWQHTVMTIYEKRLHNKFPLNQHSSDMLSFVDFEQFFGPSGILSTYMKLIEPVYHHKALITKLDKENLQAFTTMDKILHHWFDNYKKPRLYLTFVPVELEKNANKFTLEIGSKKLEFSKKMDKTSEFIWPEHGDNITTIEFENTLGQSSIKNQNSPWSLIQLFNESDIETLHEQKDFVITFKLDAFRAKYHIMLQNDFDIKSYGGLTEFHLHQQL